MPHLTKTGQASTPKTAQVPHYQPPLAEIQSEIDDYPEAGGQILFKLYEADKDYSNNFLHVINSGVDGLDGINWDALAKLANKKETGDKKRQRKYQDYGTTAGRCTSRKKNSSWSVCSTNQTWNEGAVCR